MRRTVTENLVKVKLEGRDKDFENRVRGGGFIFVSKYQKTNFCYEERVFVIGEAQGTC